MIVVSTPSDVEQKLEPTMVGGAWVPRWGEAAHRTPRCLSVACMSSATGSSRHQHQRMMKAEFVLSS